MAINFPGGRYTPNRGPTGIVGIGTSAPMGAALLRVVEKGRSFAESIAPVETGEYRASFETEVSTRGEGDRKRSVGLLANTSEHAAAVEFGNTRAPTQRVLGRTLEQLKADA